MSAHSLAHTSGSRVRQWPRWLAIAAALSLAVTGLGALTPAAAAAAGATLFVAEHGTDTNNCSSPPQSCATITHALMLAASGDTIDVSGTIVDNNVTVPAGDTITVTGVPAASDSPAPPDVPTVVNGNNTANTSVFTDVAGATLNLDDLTIENGPVDGISNGSGSVTVTDSTLTGNGRGIGNGSGSVTVTDSTITGNNSGGGITEGVGPVTVTDSTITGNSGSGIADFRGGPVTLGASILAGNGGGNCLGNVPTSVGFNLTDDASRSACGFTAATDVVGANPMLGPLQDNGGPTATLLPAATSPAVGAIPDSTSLTVAGTQVAVCGAGSTDQRGMARPLGSRADCTIGATEVVAPPETITVTGAAASGTEGAALSARVATFISNGPFVASDYTATINWGDGTNPSTGTIGIADSPRGFTVDGTHTYTEEGSFTVTISVTDTTSQLTVTGTGTATVADADTYTFTSVGVSAVVGTPFSGDVASVSDSVTATSASDLSATIDWGDGTSSSGTVSGGSGSFTVAGQHTYTAAGNFPASITIAERSPGTSEATLKFTAVVGKGTLVAGTPSISGTVKVGSKLTAKTGTWTAGTRFAFRWLRDGAAITGATGSTYTPVAADAGGRLAVRVTGSKTGYTTVSKTSTAEAVVKGTLTTATPRITGTVKVGKTLTAVPGAWTAGTRFSYQWRANGRAIAGAHNKRLRLTAKLRGKRISVKVTGTKPGYTTATRLSRATGPVKPA